MRFMMMMIPEVYQGSHAKNLKPDFAPDVDDVEKMTKYNEALTKAGALISLDGLHPPTNGARVSFAGGKPKVTDGPFTESKEVLGGYWIIKATIEGGSDRLGETGPRAERRRDRSPADIRHGGFPGRGEEGRRESSVRAQVAKNAK